MQSKAGPAEDPGSEMNDPAADTSVVGRVLNERFLVESDLTHPSFAPGFTAYLVKDLKNFCGNAVLRSGKALPDDSGGEAPSLRQVSETIRQIAHRSIEEVLETGYFPDGRPYSLSAYYPGKTLDSIIAGGKRMTLAHAARVLEQIAEALGAAHKRSVIHCDVRPANIIVPLSGLDDKKVLLSNFGYAWPVDARGESLSNIGSDNESTSYASPELLVRLGHRSPASDIYSFSVLAYRLLTGSVPFKAGDRSDQLLAIKSGEATPPTELRTDLSQEAERLVISGLQFEPAWRPQDIDDFGIRLVRALRPPQGILPAAETAAEPAVTAEPETPVEPRPPQQAEVPKRRQKVERKQASAAVISDKAVTWALIILLMAGALSIPIGQTFLFKNETAAAVDTIAPKPAAETVRRQVKFRVDRPAAPASRPPGPALSATGEIAVLFDTPGSLYVVAESADTNGRPFYRLIFPARQPAAAAAAEAGKQLKVLVPGGEQAARAMWIIWMTEGNEIAAGLISASAEGVSSEAEAGRSLRHFLERNRNMRVRVSTDGTGWTVLDSPGDKIVHRTELVPAQ